MLHLKIRKIDGDDYVLAGNDNNEYHLSFVIYGEKAKLQVGDEIFLHTMWVDEHNEYYSGTYYIGALYDPCGVEIHENQDHIDHIVVETKHGEVLHFKRLYG